MTPYVAVTQNVPMHVVTRVFGVHCIVHIQTCLHARSRIASIVLYSLYSFAFFATHSIKKYIRLIIRIASFKRMFSL